MQQPSGQGFSLDTVRRTVEDKVLEAVDSVINRIPNGQQYRGQFQQAIGSALDNLQQQAQSQMGGLGGYMGGMMGSRPDQPQPPIR